MNASQAGRCILISGATGLLGSSLASAATAAGARVVKLVRHAASAHDERQWDPASGRLDPAHLADVDVVVHLSGAVIVGKRWSQKRRAMLRSSRIDSARLLAETIAEAKRRPSTFLSGSAIGYYGDRGDEILTEESGPGPTGIGEPGSFMTQICLDWEAATQPAAAAGVRVVHLRTGLVLDAERGLLKPMLPLFRLGLGGRIGDGSQWMSWIAIDDHVAAMMHLIDSGLSGPVNLVAPNPVRNADFTRALGAALGRPAVLRVPTAALYARFGREEARGTALTSIRVVPQRLGDDRFEFADPHVGGALRHILGS